MNRYKNSMHFTDRMIDRVLKDLQKRGELDNTLIILTGDHGQEINDTRNNFWGHNSNFAKYQTHVPMFVWMPGTPGGVKTTAPIITTWPPPCSRTPTAASTRGGLFHRAGFV